MIIPRIAGASLWAGRLPRWGLAGAASRRFAQRNYSTTAIKLHTINLLPRL